MVDVAEVLKVLGQRSRGHRPAVETARELVRHGMPARVLDILATRLNIPVGEVQIIAGIPPATAARKRGGNETLRPMLSDRLFRIASVYTLAKQVLENDDKAATWLQEPNRALHGERPLDMLDTEVGTREVELILNRLEHGVYS
jgi:putative toxin-antitoxin system antitoxin component (TIGR02293 family)